MTKRQQDLRRVQGETGAGKNRPGMSQTVVAGDEVRGKRRTRMLKFGVTQSLNASYRDPHTAFMYSARRRLLGRPPPPAKLIHPTTGETLGYIDPVYRMVFPAWPPSPEEWAAAHATRQGPRNPKRKGQRL